MWPVIIQFLSLVEIAVFRLGKIFQPMRALEFITCGLLDGLKLNLTEKRDHIHQLHHRLNGFSWIKKIMFVLGNGQERKII